MLSAISFGRRYLLASFIYVGLALILGNAIPATPIAADESACPEGMVCCDDNTSGSAATCACCSASDGQPTTIQCVQPAPLPSPTTNPPYVAPISQPVT
jgi:hypothetical protein